MYDPKNNPNAEHCTYVCEGECRNQLEDKGMVIDKIRIPAYDDTPAWWCSTARLV